MTFNWKIGPTPVPTDHWMVAVKYAPKDAPEISKGRWTLPVRALENEKLMQSIMEHGIRLQQDLEDIKRRQVDRRLSNPQRLWQDFKREISAIAKAQIKATYYKMNTHICLLEKDIKALTNDENADTDDKIQSEEAFLIDELKFLEKKAAKNRRNTLSAELANHGEVLGGVWTAISKEKKPRDMIQRLTIPGSNPPQYECNTQRMAKLAKDYHERLQQDGLENNDKQNFEMETICVVISRVVWNQGTGLKGVTELYLRAVRGEGGSPLFKGVPRKAEKGYTCSSPQVRPAQRAQRLSHTNLMQS